MSKPSLTLWSRGKLRTVLVVFFIALMIPSAVLIFQAWSQLKWEAFHRHSLMAEELARRIDRTFTEIIRDEEARPFTDYAFLNVAGDPASNFIQRSPLSGYPVDSDVPGLIGYFQVDNQGILSTPLLPQVPRQSLGYGITEQELQQRLSLQDTIQRILSENRLVGKQQEPQQPSGEGSSQVKEGESITPDLDRGLFDDKNDLYSSDEAAGMPVPEEMEVTAQEAFDELEKDDQQLREQRKRNSQKIQDLGLDISFENINEVTDQLTRAKKNPDTVIRSKRREQNVLPETIVAPQPASERKDMQDQLRISIFESEIDSFELSMLDSGHFVLFRKVWREGQRYIQGALINPQQFIQNIVEATYRNTALSQMSDLTVAYQGNVYTIIHGRTGDEYLASAEDLSGALLYQSSLSSPLSDIDLVFSVKNLPAGPGGVVVTWAAGILLLIMVVGFFLMYRLGLRQINLTRQQQDFVSAVSHELKTPLTSIRMYGEMLREGWVEEDKKKTYYDYIFEESERLSRLISNVLQLARMTRNDLQVDMKPVQVSELIDGIRSKVSSQVDRAGFDLGIACDANAGTSVISVDPDCFVQIMINLVDNAIKFSRNAETRKIEIKCSVSHDNCVLFRIRDYGPGVGKGHMRKIFRLFYRSENELTRETVGTGIGLALVKQLTQKMEGNVDVVNCNPGAEFQVRFPVVECQAI